MNLRLSFVAACLGLAGCASGASTGAVATCTDLISTGGGMLKYCQSGNRIEATETGVEPKAEPATVKVVDDLEVLQGLQKQAGLRPEFLASRKIVARACVADGVNYLSVSVKDLRRILSSRQATPLPDVIGSPEAPIGGQTAAPS